MSGYRSRKDLHYQAYSKASDDRDRSKDRGRDRDREYDRDRQYRESIRDRDRDRDLDEFREANPTKAMPSPTATATATATAPRANPPKLATGISSPSITQSPTFPSPRANESPSVLQGPTLAGPRSTIKTSTTAASSAQSASPVIPKTVQTTADADLARKMQKMTDSMAKRAQLMQDLKRSEHVWAKRNAEYNRQRERTPNAPAAIEFHRLAMERAEKEYKALDKAHQEQGERQLRDIEGLFMYINSVRTSKEQTAKALKPTKLPTAPLPQELGGRIEVLEKRMGQQLNKQMAEQIEKKVREQVKKQVEKQVEERLEKRMQEQDRVWGEKLQAQWLQLEKQGQDQRRQVEKLVESQHLQFDNQIQELRQQWVAQSGRDRASAKASAELATAAKRKLEEMMEDLQKTWNSQKSEDNHKSIANSSKSAVASSQVAITETQKLREDLQTLVGKQEKYAALEQSMEEVASKLVNMEAFVSQLKDRPSVSPNEVAQLHDLVQGLFERVAAVVTSAEDQKATIHVLSQQVATHSNKLCDFDPGEFEKLYWECDSNFPRIKMQLEGSQAEGAALKGRLESLEQRFQSQSESQSQTAEMVIQKQEGNYDDVAATIRATELATERATEALNMAKVAKTSADSAGSATKKLKEGIAKVIENLDQNSAQMHKTYGGLIDDCKKRVNEVKSRVAYVEDQMANVQSMIAQTQTKVEEDETRLKEIETEVAGRRAEEPVDGLTALKETVDGLTAMKKTVDGLTAVKETVDGMVASQETLSNSLTKYSRDTSHLSARLDAQDQMHQTLQSQYQNLTTKDVYEAIIAHLDRRYPENMAVSLLHHSQEIDEMRRNLAETKRDFSDIRSNLLGDDGRDNNKRRRIGVDGRATFGSFPATNGNY